MKKEKVIFDSLRLVGLSVRTNNRNEQDIEKAQISKLVKKYFSQGASSAIQDRVNPGVTYTVYTDYDSDYRGDYTFFIGEVVNTFANQEASRLTHVTLESGIYQKFTTPAGEMPTVVIEAWEEIWGMSESELGGKRAYRSDFEVYDHRAQNPNHTVVDIYIGIL